MLLSTSFLRYISKIWWAGMDSNHRKLSWRIYSPFPLTTRAPTHIMVTLAGLEPATLWFVVKYSNPTELQSHIKNEQISNELALTSKKVVGPFGLEPKTDRLWAGCSTNWAIGPEYMERKTRLELATPTLARWCSTTELFPQIHVQGLCSPATFMYYTDFPVPCQRVFAIKMLSGSFARQHFFSTSR